MNDLHTGSLTRELAERLDASALINDDGDRNDVDLNRIGAAHDEAPAFLDALGELLDAGLTGDGRLCVLTVHGWNVVQPAVDIGLGVSPTPTALCGGGGSAVCRAFAASVLPRLAGQLSACGIAATPGLRYPARARENLLQLFTSRYLDDARPAVRRLARRADRVDAVQLELSLPLRLPGPWRDAFVEACARALGDQDDAVGRESWPAWNREATGPTESVALEFVAPGLSGLAAVDAHGGRLLLFPEAGGLVTFTGERVGCHDPDQVAGLRMTVTGSGDVDISYEGPMLVFDDTAPFVDLEAGLARARITPAEVTLRFAPSHDDGADACPFGTVRGHARIGGHRFDVGGHGVRSRREVGLGAWPRAGLRLANGTVIVGRGGDGIICRNGTHVPLRGCVVRSDDTPVSIGVEAADGTRLEIAAVSVHRLPVVPGEPGAGRVVFVACRHDDALAGWIALRSA